MRNKTILCIIHHMPQMLNIDNEKETPDFLQFFGVNNIICKKTFKADGDLHWCIRVATGHAGEDWSSDKQLASYPPTECHEAWTSDQSRPSEVAQVIQVTL